ncbi:uncharacterized protein LOC127259846 [Andrographis paniculata]|uniref:uncharacterized protein LOC127259846 n=1 Tax=Andrographis paniculata TaxID=175694 RepID=UPI0021E930B2|nr:uncharacterized protein LOC127259846 [Andrographis paniculata]
MTPIETRPILHPLLPLLYSFFVRLVRSPASSFFHLFSFSLFFFFPYFLIFLLLSYPYRTPEPRRLRLSRPSTIDRAPLRPFLTRRLRAAPARRQFPWMEFVCSSPATANLTLHGVWRCGT